MPTSVTVAVISTQHPPPPLVWLFQLTHSFTIIVVIHSTSLVTISATGIVHWTSIALGSLHYVTLSTTSWCNTLPHYFPHSMTCIAVVIQSPSTTCSHWTPSIVPSSPILCCRCHPSPSTFSPLIYLGEGVETTRLYSLQCGFELSPFGLQNKARQITTSPSTVKSCALNLWSRFYVFKHCFLINIIN
jgi:hypothetical protein